MHYLPTTANAAGIAFFSDTAISFEKKHSFLVSDKLISESLNPIRTLQSSESLIY